MGVLTAGSPCAVVLVPLAYVCAIATITRRGVLVRSGAALDALLSCSTVALDKTGEGGAPTHLVLLFMFTRWTEVGAWHKEGRRPSWCCSDRAQAHDGCSLLA